MSHLSVSDMPKARIPQRAIAVAALALGLTAAGVLGAKAIAAGDDRGQIIVRSGSLIVESGTDKEPGPGWSADNLFGEFKPKDPPGKEFKGVKEFEVWFEKPY